MKLDDLYCPRNALRSTHARIPEVDMYSRPHAYFQPPYKFILMVVAISVTLDIPRFFHFSLEKDSDDYW